MSLSPAQWHNQLRSLDTKENHQESLQLLEDAFLDSPYADNRQTRTKVLLLIRHFGKIV